MQKEVSCGAVIYRTDEETKERKYLVLKYGYGHWDFVKGNIEKGEPELKTVTREAKEEAGIDDLRFIFGFRKIISFFFKRDGELVDKHVTFYIAETKKKDVKLSFEHTDYRWLPLRDALELVTYKTAKDLLAAADRFLEKGKQTNIYA